VVSRKVVGPCLVAIVLLVGRLGTLSHAAFPERPKLIVLIVIDQFRYDYLTRFRPHFTAKGFNLLLDGGAVFTDCRYDYASTITGPGHASLATGAYPNQHGIIDNEWYDRTQHRAVYCVEDLSTHTVASQNGPGPTPAFSPRNLIGSTLGDELRAATDFRSKVIAISLKDRAAILLGGHTATAAYWYEAGSGRFVTSTYYESALPPWVETFNQRAPARDFCGQVWKALPVRPGDTGTVFSEFHPSPGEPCPDPRFLGWLNDTPFMNEIELAFASEAVRGEHLGQGEDTDLLAVSLSVNDYVGHASGPYSEQVSDTTLRTDRDLAKFFADLDKQVGLDHVWIALSADHGVAPNPAFIQEHHLGLGNAQPGAIRGGVEKAMSESLGPGPWVEDADELYVYLNRDTVKKRRIPEARAEEVAAQAAAAQPDVAAAFTRTQFLTGTLPNSPLARKAANSFNPKRSGDVFIVLAPYAVPVVAATGTSHGSPWNYDTQVPLVLWGDAFKAGVYAKPCQPIDLAATLAAVLGITQSSESEGRPLTDAIR